MSTRLRAVQFLITWAWTYIDTYIYIYIFFKFKVAILETLRVCYFRGTSLSRTRFLFFTKALRFKRWVQGSPMTCVLVISSLMLSACFIYDKRARAIYYSHSWHWYFFETSNLSDRIDLISFASKWETTLKCGAHNKAFLVTSIYSMFLLLFASIGS